MENNTEYVGWQSNACAGAVSLVPASAASYAATGLSFAGVTAIDAATGGLGQPKAVTTSRTHKSMTRPGSPPRGRHR